MGSLEHASHDAGNQIPESTMKMLTDEAWEVFHTPTQVGTAHRRPFDAAIKHVFEHAFEEGIIVIANHSD